MEQDNSFVHSTLDDGEDIYITDQWKRKYHFRMASFPAPTGLAFEAIEVKDDNSSGYQFNHLFDFDTNLELAAVELFHGTIRKQLDMDYSRTDFDRYLAGLHNYETQDLFHMGKIFKPVPRLRSFTSKLFMYLRKWI